MSLAALDLYLLDGRHLDAEYAPADVVRKDSVLEVLLDLVLVAGISVDNEPVTRLARLLFRGINNRGRIIFHDGGLCGYIILFFRLCIHNIYIHKRGDQG